MRKLITYLFDLAFIKVWRHPGALILTLITFGWMPYSYWLVADDGLLAALVGSLTFLVLLVLWLQH
jgi:hypothetical protein